MLPPVQTQALDVLATLFMGLEERESGQSFTTLSFATVVEQLEI